MARQLPEKESIFSSALGYVARWDWLKALECNNLRIRVSPAGAQKHTPTSCDREQGVQSSVEKE